MAIVPENRRLFAPMTVLENLEMGAYLRPKADLKEDFERVYSLFPLLHERRTQLAGTLSGGEQQMVAMGRALMSRPKLLLMDEPSMGLAPILVERSFEIIREVHEAGVAILVVEQNANVSLSIADRGYVLSTGRVVLEGTASDLLAEREPAEGLPWSLTPCAQEHKLAVNEAVAPPRTLCPGTQAAVSAGATTALGEAVRGRFPVFRDKVYVNSCSQGALSDAVRAAYGEYLDGWDREGRAVGVLGRALRGGACGFGAPRREPGRRRDHDLALRGRERARQRAPLRHRTQPHRHLRNTSSRPSARSGTRRSCAGPRSCASRPSRRHSRRPIDDGRRWSARRTSPTGPAR